MKQLEGKSLEDSLVEVKKQADKINVAPADYCRTAIKNTTITDSSARAWTYQYCTQYGFYQVPSKIHPMRMTILETNYWVDYCNELYGTSLKISRAHNEFAGHHTSGSNTIITNGGEDPW